MRLPGGEKQLLARRALYEAEKGPLREGYVLVPSCGDECCIEPDHQKQITDRQKSQIGAKVSNESPTKAAAAFAHRIAKGLTRLTEEQVREIRTSDELGQRLAERFGVHPKTISDVRLGKSWRGVGNPFAGLL